MTFSEPRKWRPAALDTRLSSLGTQALALIEMDGLLWWLPLWQLKTNAVIIDLSE